MSVQTSVRPPSADATVRLVTVGPDHVHDRSTLRARLTEYHAWMRDTAGDVDDPEAEPTADLDARGSGVARALVERTIDTARDDDRACRE